KPFAPGAGAVRIWAKFDLPRATPPRRELLGVGPWEHVEYFVVTDGKLVDHQVVGQLVPWRERSERITTTPIALYGGLIAVELLGPDHPWWDFYFLWIGLLASGSALAQFLRSYLDTPRYFPRIDRWLRIYAYVQLAFLPAVFFLPAPIADHFDAFNILGPVGM